MKLSTANLQSSMPIMALVLATGQAFTASPLRSSNPVSSSFMTTHYRPPSPGFAIRNNLHNSNAKAFRLQATTNDALVPPEMTDEEIERLKQMAAKLRAEAAQLEAEQQQAVAQAATKAFERFDVNRDGHVDLDELKVALEKTFKLELSSDDEQQVLEKVFSKFDINKDGVLSQDEFVSLEQFKNQFDQVTRDEKAMSRRAMAEQEAAEQVTAMLQAQIELINEGEPSVTDKIVSILPYLFPLLDGLQFARFFVLDNPESPLALAAGVLYGLYRSIPFGGFLAFLALTIFSGNPTINRLIRFNMQQAIYLDIALFVPGLLITLASTVAGGGGGDGAGPAAALVQQLGSDGVFLGLLVILGYTTVSSLLGKEPDKLPFISNAVKRRMPTIEMFMDAQGRFSQQQQPRIEQEKKQDDKDTTTEDKKD